MSWQFPLNSEKAKFQKQKDSPFVGAVFLQRDYCHYRNPAPSNGASPRIILTAASNFIGFPVAENNSSQFSRRSEQGRIKRFERTSFFCEESSFSLFLTKSSE
jgi:hypothetical protein